MKKVVLVFMTLIMSFCTYAQVPDVDSAAIII